ncbi:MAG: hypothetical protein ACLSEY_11955 [Enterocloster sp.]
MARKATKTPEELAAAHTKYKNAWQRENKDRIPITVPIGDKDRIAAWSQVKRLPEYKLIHNRPHIQRHGER